jgi:Helitron helicase-like domain at N-terminus
MEFPSYTYNGGSSTDCLLVDICGDMNRPCNEYDPKHLMRAMPCLFPFGVGGFGMDKLIPISLGQQLAAFLQRSDGCYAKHEVFMFVAFNIFQRRIACLGARLVTRRSSLNKVSKVLEGLNYNEVKRRLAQDRKGGKNHWISDPKLMELWRLTGMANGMVRGSPEYVRNRRSEIRGLFMRFGSPMFFITINPDDARHPLVLCFVVINGGKLELPTSEGWEENLRMRYKLIAENPVAQAQFFDTVFRAVVEVLFGSGNEKKLGMFGNIEAHYAMIEAQGKGTLHAHGLIWIVGGKIL